MDTPLSTLEARQTATTRGMEALVERIEALEETAELVDGLAARVAALEAQVLPSAPDQSIGMA